MGTRSLANIDYTDGPVNPDTRRISRGPEVDFNRLRVDVIQSRSRHMAGTYYFADFSEKAWWKAPDWSQAKQRQQEQRQSGPWRDYTNQQSYQQAEEAYRRAEQERARKRQEQFRRDQEQRRQEYEDFRRQGRNGNSSHWRSSGGFDWEDFFGDHWRSGGGSGGRGGATGYASSDDWSVIGCQQNASQDVAKKAYRSKIASVHPDRHPSTEKDKWTAEAQKVNAAWDRIRKSQGWA